MTKKTFRRCTDIHLMIGDEVVVRGVTEQGFELFRIYCHIMQSVIKHLFALEID